MSRQDDLQFVMDWLNGKGERIVWTLEREKEAAIARQDFDAAVVLKEQIAEAKEEWSLIRVKDRLRNWL